MVSAIFASKLYQVSNRKDRIHSAYMNPLNAELVQQIDSYVSPKYQKMLNDEESQESSEMNTQQGDDAGAPSPSGGGSSGGGGGSSFSGGGSASLSDEELPGMITDEPNDSDGPDASETDVSTDNTSNDASESDESVEQSTILASCTSNDAALEVDIIKGSLNLKEDTGGVSRVRVKDKELWIYYQDSINLNSVMSSVIDTMNSLGYTYLEFSRLARSDNAIVFDIYDSSEPIQSISGDDNEEKEKA